LAGKTAEPQFTGEVYVMAEAMNHKDSPVVTQSG